MSGPDARDPLWPWRLLGQAAGLREALESLVADLDQYGGPRWFGSPMEQRARTALSSPLAEKVGAVLEAAARVREEYRRTSPAGTFGRDGSRVAAIEALFDGVDALQAELKNEKS